MTTSYDEFPRDAMESTDSEGDFAKQHLVNTHVLRLLGDVHARRVLDGGCGHGYFARMLARGGAEVVGVEPSRSMHAYALEREAELGQGIRYLRADLTRLPALGAPFDAVVLNNVLQGIPDWRAATREAVEMLEPGGLLVIVINHPCFEQLRGSWQVNGHFRSERYLEEYETPVAYGVNVHRTLSTYINQLCDLGLRIRELVEPGLDPAAAAEAAENGTDGLEAYVRLPNFLIVAAEQPATGDLG